MLCELRQARFGYLLALHILLLCAKGHTPTEIAAFLFCSRSSVYRAVEAYRRGEINLGGRCADPVTPPGRLSRYIPSLQRSLLSILKCAPETFGWCRTRWSCATLAAELKARRGITVSQEKVRRWLHELDYVWKRARHAALDSDPERITKLARIRHLIEHVRPSEMVLFIDELDIHLLPKIGYEWMLKGTQTEIMTPGQNQKQYLAGALNYLTGKITHVTAERKNRWLVIDLLRALDRQFPAATKMYLIADNYRIHKAKAVEEWLNLHLRFEIVWLPSYCPKANPIERAFGDVHDKCTRNHKRTRINELVGDVLWHLKRNGPWRYQLSSIYYTPEVDAAVAELCDTQNSKAA
ncbi:MAG: IS630 family transposase [Acidobacteriota bacterium]|nr:IS630 family transposase [Acidobacteriota bacterium]